MDSINTYNARLASVVENLLELYEAPEASAWLKTPQSLLGNARPADLLWTERGYLEVSAVIHRVLDGAFI